MPPTCPGHACGAAACLRKVETFFLMLRTWHSWDTSVSISICFPTNQDFRCRPRGRESPHRRQWPGYWEREGHKFRSEPFLKHVFISYPPLICTSPRAWGSRCWRGFWWSERLVALRHESKTPCRSLWWSLSAECSSPSSLKNNIDEGFVQRMCCFFLNIDILSYL